MNEHRRTFLKWLSATSLVSVGACASPKLKTPPEAPAKSVADTASSSAMKAGEYASGEDSLRMRKTRSYGMGLPDDPQCPVTGPDVLGPFHRRGAPMRTVIAGPEEPGKRLSIRGQVLHHDCKTPVVGALLDIWHADAKGRYDNDSADYRLRAQVKTDADQVTVLTPVLGRPTNVRQACVNRARKQGIRRGAQVIRWNR